MSNRRNAPKPHIVHDTPGFTAEADFTGGYVLAQPEREERLEKDEQNFERRIQRLVNDWGCNGNEALICELITTALKLGHDGSDEGEMKLINRSLKEMRYANNVFRPYQHRRKVTIFGSARTKPGEPEYVAAAEFARKMAGRDFMSITGAGPGIMAAAQEGATAANSFGLRIQLPFEAGANATIEGDPKLINFNYFFTRKLMFVKEAHAAALFPGGFGTMDEGFEVLTLIQTGKAVIFPIVMIDAPGGSYWKTFLQFIKEHLFRLGLISEQDFSIFKVTDDVDEAVEHIVNFYTVFNSYRYVRDNLVLRLNRALTAKAVRKLNENFGDLLVKGEYVLGNAMPEEANEPEIFTLPRLICKPKRSDYGQLRKLLDAINDSDVIG